ncbi:MAG: universal stress protein [Heteroscytonema crispum UTEX LB 1556]
MYNKILVALDRSEMGKEVFEQALALAKTTGANLMLLHVLSGEEEGSPYLPTISSFDYYPGVRGQSFEVYQQQWEKFKNECLEMLQAFCVQANTAGISTEFTQNLGSPGRSICDLARSWGADLIIMGRRGRSGLTEIFLGSVSNYVLHHAPCSVHIVHPKICVKQPEVTKESISTSSIS